MVKQREKTSFEKHVLPGLRVGSPVFVFQQNGFHNGKIISIDKSSLVVEVQGGVQERRGIRTEVPGWTQPFKFSRFTGWAFKRNAWLV